MWHTWDYGSVDSLKESFVRNVSLNYKIDQELVTLISENDPNIAIDEHNAIRKLGVAL